MHHERVIGNWEEWEDALLIERFAGASQVPTTEWDEVAKELVGERRNGNQLRHRYLYTLLPKLRQAAAKTLNETDAEKGPSGTPDTSSKTGNPDKSITPVTPFKSNGQRTPREMLPRTTRSSRAKKPIYVEEDDTPELTDGESDDDDEDECPPPTPPPSSIDFYATLEEEMVIEKAVSAKVEEAEAGAALMGLRVHRQCFSPANVSYARQHPLTPSSGARGGHEKEQVAPLELLAHLAPTPARGM